MENLKRGGASIPEGYKLWDGGHPWGASSSYSISSSLPTVTPLLTSTPNPSALTLPGCIPQLWPGTCQDRSEGGCFILKFIKQPPVKRKVNTRRFLMRPSKSYSCCCEALKGENRAARGSLAMRWTVMREQHAVELLQNSVLTAAGLVAC